MKVAILDIQKVFGLFIAFFEKTEGKIVLKGSVGGGELLGD